MRAAYGAAHVEERHRHRYEVNNAYRDQLEAAGLVFSGTSPDNNLVEFVELPADVHPYYVATQAHPELRSRPTRPHPLFAGLIEAAIQRQRELLIPIDESCAAPSLGADEDDDGRRRRRGPVAVRESPTSPSWPVLGSRDLHRDDWVVALREDAGPAPRATPRRPSAGWWSSTRAPSSCSRVDDAGARLLPPAVPPRRRRRSSSSCPAGHLRRGRRGPAGHRGRASCGRRSSCRPSTGDTC